MYFVEDSWKTLGAVFLLSVFWGGALINIFNWGMAKRYVESQGYTRNAAFILISGVIWQLMGGLLLIRPSTMALGALLLIFFTVISSIQFYPFWRKEGLERYDNLIHFLSNIGVIGGLLLLLSPIYILKFPFNFSFLRNAY